MRWTAAASVVVGFGLAGWTAVGHIASGNPKLSNADTVPIWRASLTPAIGQADGQSAARSVYLLSPSTTFSVQADADAGKGARTVAAATDDPFEAVAKKAKLSSSELASAFSVARTASAQADVDAWQAIRTAAAAPATENPFDAVVKKANLTSAKLAGMFKGKRVTAVQVAMAEPTNERFGVAGHAATPPVALTELAYAAPSESRAAHALHSLADEEDQSVNDLAARDAEIDVPESGPIPGFRPSALKPKATVASLPQEPQEEIAAPVREKPVAAERDKADERPLVDKPRKRLVAGRQNEPGAEKLDGGLGWSFRNIFSSGARAGKGVAVYDISAAKVYMPDGSVLEAHSGIGKMADNPKYVNVKMNGPTPPHTYNLRMRETRFHGVEAIRMLPVDGKNKHGRDGFLTHSYLLRGKTAQSHGCVAFKDYNKFLNAFKKGKIKQMVVVSSGGRSAATRLASN